MITLHDIKYVASKLDAKDAKLRQLAAELEGAPGFKFIQLRLKDAIEV